VAWRRRVRRQDAAAPRAVHEGRPGRPGDGGGAARLRSDGRRERATCPAGRASDWAAPSWPPCTHRALPGQYLPYAPIAAAPSPATRSSPRARRDRPQLQRSPDSCAVDPQQAADPSRRHGGAPRPRRRHHHRRRTPERQLGKPLRRAPHRSA
jgi:hypothetical protein